MLFGTGQGLSLRLNRLRPIDLIINVPSVESILKISFILNPDRRCISFHSLEDIFETLLKITVLKLSKEHQRE